MTTAGQVLQGAVRSSVERYTVHAAAIHQAAHAEAVHQARVALRRLRSDLRTFEPILDADWSSGFSERLRGLSVALSAARDADVLIERLERGLTSLAEHRERAAAVLDPFHAARREAYAALCDVLASDRHAVLVQEMAAAAQAPLFAARALGDARDELPPVMREVWRQLDKCVGALGDAPSDAHLHRVRIRAKRVRYAAEAMVPIFDDEAKAFAARVEALQTILGDQHDAVIACERLRAQRWEDADAAFTAGELAAIEAACANEGRAGWRACWEHAERKRAHFWR